MNANERIHLWELISLFTVKAIRLSQLGQELAMGRGMAGLDKSIEEELPKVQKEIDDAKAEIADLDKKIRAALCEDSPTKDTAR